VELVFEKKGGKRKIAIFQEGTSKDLRKQAARSAKNEDFRPLGGKKEGKSSGARKRGGEKDVMIVRTLAEIKKPIKLKKGPDKGGRAPGKDRMGKMSHNEE